MIIVGELINASRKSISTAIEARDTKAIQKVAKDQLEAGANYIDVNAGVFVGKEPEYLEWLVSGCSSCCGCPLLHRQSGSEGHRGRIVDSQRGRHDQFHLFGEGAF